MSKFLDKLTKKFNSELEVTTKESPLTKEKVWVTSGIPLLDWNLQTFGFKKGFVEIAGTSRAGKTSLGLGVVANFQAKYEDGICIYLLSEERIDDNYAARLGVDNTRLFKIREKNLEDLFYTLQNKLEDIERIWNDEKMDGNPKIIILWDSISATLSKSELITFRKNAKEYGESKKNGKVFKEAHAKISSFAKNARDFTKAIHAQLYEKDLIFICLNHLTDDIGNPHGGKTSTGGSWRQYFCYIRIYMQPDKLLSSKEKIDDEPWGQITDVKIEKNDFGGYKRTKLKLCLGHGFTLTDEDIEYAVKKKILKQEEKTFSFLNGKLTWKTPRSFYTLYRSENKLMKLLHKKIIQERHKDLLENLNKNNEEE